jgi:AGZA family xanthine/uracil permease-like MFS transporter
MVRNVTKIAWDDASEAIPAFLTIVGIPLSFSIADGLALGFVSYAAIKLLCGRWRDIGWLTALLAVLLLGYFLFVREAVR